MDSSKEFKYLKCYKLTNQALLNKFTVLGENDDFSDFLLEKNLVNLINKCESFID